VSREPDHPHAPVSWNTASLYTPLNNEPAGFDGRRRYVHVIGPNVLVSDDPGDPLWASHFIGLVDGVSWWAVDAPPDDRSDGDAIDLRSFFGAVTTPEWFAAGRAAQIVHWTRTHRFCGSCGESTVQLVRDRGLRCPNCELVSYPRVSPAMIVLVTRGAPGPDQEVLLAKGVRFPLYTCLAGFVEAGEDLEGAVIREVREEVGIDVNDVRYVGSQPWPFPHSLMIGFRASHASGDLVLAPDEIVDAQWYRRNNLPELPPPLAIARRIIENWRDEL
jgi:NAD+ diphosphatase